MTFRLILAGETAVTAPRPLFGSGQLILGGSVFIRNTSDHIESRLTKPNFTPQGIRHKSRQQNGHRGGM